MKNMMKMSLCEIANAMNVTVTSLSLLPIQKVEKIFQDFCNLKSYEAAMTIHFLTGELVKAE